MFATSRLAIGLRIGVICSLLLGLLGGLRWLHGLDNWLTTTAFAVRGPLPPNPQVVIVALDAASEGRLRPLPWPEEAWLRGLGRLLAARPRVVALDVADWRRIIVSEEGEARRVTALIAGQPVVLGFAIREGSGSTEPPPSLLRFACGASALPEPPSEGRMFVTPPSGMVDNAAGVGALNIYPDLDSVVRSVPLLISHRSRAYPSLALETWRVAQRQAPATARLGARGVRVGETVTPVLPTGEMLINYAGGYLHYPVISFHDLLAMDRSKLAEAVGGKLVVIGPTQGSAMTALRTPVAARLPGVEIQANAIGNLAQGDSLRPLPAWAWLGALLVGSLLTGVLVTWQRVVPGFVLTLSLTLLAALGLFLLFRAGYWMPWAAPLLGVAGTGLALVVRQASIADESKLQVETEMRARLEAIARIGELVDSSLDRQQLLGQIMQWVEAELDVEACSLLLVSEDRKRLHFEVALGPKGDLAKDFVLQMGEGIVGIVAETGQPIIVNDARNDPRRQKDIAQAINYQLDKVLCVPMTLRGEVVGVLEVMNKRDSSDFSKQDCSLLTVIAQQASLFLENARLYGVLQQRVEYANAELLSAMRELRLEKARVETLVEEMVDGVLAVDPEKRVLLINSVARQMLDLAPEPVEGRLLEAVLTQPQLHLLFEHSLSVDEPSVSEEVDLVGDGSRVVRATVARIAGPGNEPVGQCAVLTDITHFKQLDQMKTDLVSFVSHELKTPLTSIGLYGHMLREKLKAGSAAEAQDMAAAIDRQNTRMKHMVEDFLNLSRIEAGRPLDMLWHPIMNVQAFVDEVVAIEARTTRDHEIALSLPAESPGLWADRGKLEEVFINLVNNAIKYSPDGGVISVAATLEGDMMRFSVTDCGLGITPEAQSRLFQRFQRVGDKSRVSGTGLGLFVCKALIEAHGGRIWCDSEEGKGSTFHFTVPLYRGQDKEGLAGGPTDQARSG